MKKLFALTVFLFTFNLGAFAAPAQNFKLPSKDGGNISLADLKGNVVYVDFWASWCAPCRKSFPWMNEMHDKYASQGLKIIGISLDGTQKSANNFLKKVPASFMIAYDTEGTTADAYNVQVMPTSYLIDRQGNLLFSHKGFRAKHKKKMEAEFVKALAGQ
ncbi:MAG TPA: TlpA family protein disulfide reductase [Gammaproteobacteria bacterium]|nr:TlpA family protein disulfide reductase [Gammaproteobacteria bacterium]